MYIAESVITRNNVLVHWNQNFFPPYSGHLQYRRGLWLFQKCNWRLFGEQQLEQQSSIKFHSFKGLLWNYWKWGATFLRHSRLVWDPTTTFHLHHHLHFHLPPRARRQRRRLELWRQCWLWILWYTLYCRDHHNHQSSGKWCPRSPQEEMQVGWRKECLDHVLWF